MRVGLLERTARDEFGYAPRLKSAGSHSKGHLRRDDAPAGRKSGAGSFADENVIVKIPNICLPCNRIGKQVIRFAVAIKIGYSHHLPAPRKSWARRSADMEVVIHVP